MELDRIGGSIGALVATAVLVVAVAATSAHGATHYVANNGENSTFCGFQVINGHTCGSKTSPCRSIQCAIAEADPGDTIIVGPGRYGDLDHDGTLGEEGEESGSAGCGCMLSVKKSLTILSSEGAASTVIDARSVDVAKNVLLMLNGGEFGRPGKGFTVTNTKQNQGDGIVIDSTNLKVRGNQILATIIFPFTVVQPFPDDGIDVVGAGPVLVQANQVHGQWTNGIIVAGTGKTVRNNQVSVSRSFGIQASEDALILGNVVTSTGSGIHVRDAVSVIGNAVYGNGAGIVVNASVDVPFTGAITRNNIVGNVDCGLINIEFPGLIAINNYWGAASGPGADPADTFCYQHEEASTIATPFATAPFTVSAPIKP